MTRRTLWQILLAQAVIAAVAFTGICTNNGNMLSNVLMLIMGAFTLIVSIDAARRYEGGSNENKETDDCTESDPLDTEKS